MSKAIATKLKSFKMVADLLYDSYFVKLQELHKLSCRNFSTTYQWVLDRRLYNPLSMFQAKLEERDLICLIKITFESHQEKQFLVKEKNEQRNFIHVNSHPSPSTCNKICS